MSTIDTPRPELAFTELTFAELTAARPRDDDWRSHAVCKGETKLFFAPKAERPQARARREKAAQALCDVCPVRAECRAWARLNHEYGYWGGESEDERHLLGFHVMAPIGIRRRPADDQAALLESA